MQSCAVSNVKKVSLELGGKSPLIIFSDCDLEKAVRMGMGAVFFNKGENCIAAGRLFIEDSIHDMFVNRVVKEGATLVYGGQRVGTCGLFFSPTIFTDVSDSMWIAEEESFGPIMIISKFPHGDVDGVID